MVLYGVIILDLVGSRNVKDRRHVQNQLDAYIDKVNEKYAKILVTPITITLGDEWQVITSSPSECYQIVSEFQQHFWGDGISLYAGIGIGNLSTDIDKEIRKMDGTSFHLAREAIQIAKSGKSSKKYISSKNNRVYFRSDLKKSNTLEELEYLTEVAASSESDAHMTTDCIDDSSSVVLQEATLVGNLINVLIENNEILKSKMTDNQKRIILDYQRLETYRDMMILYKQENRPASIGNISEKLNASHYNTIQRNQAAIKRLLNHYCNMRSVIE